MKSILKSILYDIHGGLFNQRKAEFCELTAVNLSLSDRFWGLLVCLTVSVAASSVAEAKVPLAAHPEIPVFIDKMATEHKFDRKELGKLFAAVQRNDFSLTTIARPAEKVLTWPQYRRLLVDPLRVQAGVDFWQRYAGSFARAAEKYGVREEVLVAIIGVETRYGKIKGRHRIFDTLATLAFEFPRRSQFFRSELEHFLLLTREQKFNPLELTGSYAGAMGYGQFMPSSYRNFAIDFDADSVADLLDNPHDAIGSIANYLAENGWKRGEAVAVRAVASARAEKKLISKSRRSPEYNIAQLRTGGFSPVAALPDTARALLIELGDEEHQEYWLGLHNFSAIMSYNPRYYYAMAVYLLSLELRQARWELGGGAE